MTLRDFNSLFNNKLWTLDTTGAPLWWRRTVRFVKLIRITVSTFMENRMGFQCVALSYFITLALVPFLAFIFSVSGGLGLDDKLAQALTNMLPGNTEFFNVFMDKAENIINVAKGGVVGVISALMFFWSILWLMFQVERVFNNVWGILKIPRKIYKRFGFYFLVLALSPFLILIFGTGIAYYTNLTTLIGLDLSDLTFLPQVLGWIGLLVVVVFTLSAMYKFIPAAKVKYKNALKAALVAGIVFTVFQYLYLETQVFMARLNSVYGVLAAVPLFLIWLNFSWQIIIYGAELSYSYQNVDTYNIPEWEQENR